jgi:hypothetical protein
MIRKSEKSFNMIKIKEAGINNRIPVGSLAPPFELETIDGSPYQLTNSSKRPKVILIINTNCSACSLDKVEFEEISQELTYWDFLLVITSPQEKLVFSENDKKTPPNLLILKGNKEFLTNYKIREYPTFIILDENGKISGYPAISENIRYYYQKFSLRSNLV